MSLISSIRGLLRGRINSTRSAFNFGTNFGRRTFTIQSSVRLILLAASILAQPTQRPLSESNPVEKIGLPHFLHVAGSAITTNFMITSPVASYKEETKHLVLANQSPQNRLIPDELQKAVKLR
jgi:hypothetical protein